MSKKILAPAWAGVVECSHEGDGASGNAETRERGRDCVADCEGHRSSGGSGGCNLEESDGTSGVGTSWPLSHFIV